MKVSKIQIVIALALIVLISQSTLAIPTFQAYIEGATAGTWGNDEDTWLTTSSSFNLIVVGAYGPDTLEPLSEVTLVLSVPQGDTGTISITGGDVGATLLTVKEPVPSTIYYNPNADADIDLLTNVAGDDGYMTKNFLPDDQTLNNNHYPFQEGVSYFLLYGIGDFYADGEIHNYNADTSDPDYVPPPIPLTENSLGQEKTFSVEITGFSWVHFDVYGYETTDNGQVFHSTWDINPGSHDATYIPAPGAILLGGIGVCLVGWLRRRRTL
jgi:hypothetical protein